MRLGDFLKRADMPIMSGVNDRVVGMTEDGKPIRQTMLGDQYWDQPRQAKSWVDRQFDEGGIFAPKISDLLPAPKEINTSGTYDGPGMPGVGPIVQALWDGIKAPGRALKGETVTNRDVASTALDWGLMAAPASAPEGALRAGGIRAYHGSPHDFDRFDMGKIGSGEGAQAYGHGLYFAENEGVAKSYRDQLRGGTILELAPETKYEKEVISRIEEYSREFGGIPDETTIMRDILNDYDRAEDWFPAYDDLKARSPDGHMYEVNINANPDDFLDWDNGGEAIYRDAAAQLMRDRGTIGLNAEHAAERDAVQELLKRGIPGIKYKDAGSRGTEGGTSNYVVFDDKLINILRKYSLGGLTVGGAIGMNGVNQHDADTLRAYLGN